MEEWYQKFLISLVYIPLVVMEINFPKFSPGDLVSELSHDGAAVADAVVIGTWRLSCRCAIGSWLQSHQDATKSSLVCGQQLS